MRIYRISATRNYFSPNSLKGEALSTTMLKSNLKHEQKTLISFNSKIQFPVK